jgi:N utilization substance protein A
VPDHQLSLAIGREGQNARLAARLTGWRIDIKSETQILDEESAYAEGDWAEGEWVTDAETGEQTWVPADGSEAMSADDWATAAEEAVSEDNLDEEIATEEGASEPTLDETPAIEENVDEDLPGEETGEEELSLETTQDQETVAQDEEQPSN